MLYVKKCCHRIGKPFIVEIITFLNTNRFIYFPLEYTIFKIIIGYFANYCYNVTGN